MPLFISRATVHTQPAPDVFGTDVPANITNQGHDFSCDIAGNGFGNPADVGISVEWSSFQLPPGAILSMTLKADWSTDGSTSSVITPLYELDYSLNNGVNWTAGVFNSDVEAPASGTFSLVISPSQNVSQIKVRHEGLASVQDVQTEQSTICIGMSNLRIEMVIAEGQPACLF